MQLNLPFMPQEKSPIPANLWASIEEKTRAAIKDKLSRLLIQAVQTERDKQQVEDHHG